MTKMENREALIEQLKTVLSQRTEIAVAYLYGSHAKGVTHRFSDVDVAVLLDEHVPPGDYPYGYRAELTADLIKALRTDRVDLVIANEAPPFLRFQIVRYGRVVFSRFEEHRIAFQIKTFKDYNDVKRILDVQNAYLSERLRSGTYGK